MPPWWIPVELDRLRSQGLLRVPAAGGVEPLVPGEDGTPLINLASNNYLGLAGRDYRGGPPCGAGASRLVTGNLQAHTSLESLLAQWLCFDGVLLFSSTYAANLGTLAALGDRDTLIASDQNNHASIIDGCRLSRARVAIYPHGDTDVLRSILHNASETKRLVVTESYFSMDGDIAPLRSLREICDQYQAVLCVDEAHALGVWGPEGRGVCAMLGVVPNVLVGSLGKALGSAGGFVAGSQPLTTFLWNRARSFVFSTGLSPLATHAAAGALPLLREGTRRTELHARSDWLRSALADAPVLPQSQGPIVPLVLGAANRAVSMAARLRAQGILAPAIRPPTVPEGMSRLRLAVQCGHSREQLLHAAEVIRTCL